MIGTYVAGKTVRYVKYILSDILLQGILLQGILPQRKIADILPLLHALRSMLSRPPSRRVFFAVLACPVQITAVLKGAGLALCRRAALPAAVGEDGDDLGLERPEVAEECRAGNDAQGAGGGERGGQIEAEIARADLDKALPGDGLDCGPPLAGADLDDGPDFRVAREDFDRLSLTAKTCGEG